MLTMPTSVASYYVSPPDDDEGKLAKFFDADAVVRDEGNEHCGITAIRSWRQDVITRTPFTARPLSVEEEAGIVIVPTEVAGNFPGSPLTLNHRFTLSNGLIILLEIQ